MTRPALTQLVRHCATAAATVTSACPFSRAPPPNLSAMAYVGQKKLSKPPKSLLVKEYESLPSPKHWPVIGTTIEMMRAGGAPYMHEYCDMRHRTLGPIYKEKLGPHEYVFVADSDLMQQVYKNEGPYPVHIVPEPWTIYNEENGIQRGLFFMDGPQWSERRKSLNKVFLKRNTVSAYADEFNQVITDLLQRWTNLTESTADDTGLGTLSALERELYNWSIESLGTMIFGQRLGCVSSSDPSYTTESEDKMHDFVECVQQIFEESAKMTMIPPRLAYKMNLPVWRRFTAAAGKALSLARGYVENRVHHGIQAPVGGCPFHHAGPGILEHLTDKENIEKDEVVRIITDLFLAAADTTSHATQWALHLLARHPESQEKVLAELQAALGSDKILREEHLAKMPYVKGVIKEALRLYPVAPFLTRVLDKDIVLNGYKIPKGKMIVMSLYTTGRNEKYFKSASQFLPERWVRKKDGHEVINSYAYLPFGLGIRSCIGRRVAEVQMQLLLSRVVQRFAISNGNEKEVCVRLRMITTPEEPIRLKLKLR